MATDERNTTRLNGDLGVLVCSKEKQTYSNTFSSYSKHLNVYHLRSVGYTNLRSLSLCSPQIYTPPVNKKDINCTTFIQLRSQCQDAVVTNCGFRSIPRLTLPEVPEAWASIGLPTADSHEQVGASGRTLDQS